MGIFERTKMARGGVDSERKGAVGRGSLDLRARPEGASSTADLASSVGPAQKLLVRCSRTRFELSSLAGGCGCTELGAAGCWDGMTDREVRGEGAPQKK